MILALLLAAAPPCALAQKKDAIAQGDFTGVAYQASCASVGAAFLSGDDPTERAAAAKYGERFREAGTKDVTVPILSDFVGPVSVIHYQHYFAVTKAQREKILAHAPAETNPLVISEQLRNFEGVAGVDACLKLLRASPLVATDKNVRDDARLFWKDVPPKRLLPAEIEAAWRFDRVPVPAVSTPTVDRSIARRKRAEDQLAHLRPEDDHSTAYRALSEVGQGDAVSAAVLADAKKFLAENQGKCFFMGPKVEAASGHLPTLIALAELAKGCDSVFTVMSPLAEGLARTPDPEAALLAALPALAALDKGVCRAAGELIRVLPLTAKPSSYLALAEAFDGADACLWSSAEELAERLALLTSSQEGIDAVVALGKRLSARDELWRHGDRLVFALQRARNDAAATALLQLAAIDLKQSKSVRWAAEGEAAMYLIGGPQAEKRAATMRKYQR